MTYKEIWGKIIKIDDPLESALVDMIFEPQAECWEDLDFHIGAHGFYSFAQRLAHLLKFLGMDSVKIHDRFYEDCILVDIRYSAYIFVINIRAEAPKNLTGTIIIQNIDVHPCLNNGSWERRYGGLP